MKKSHSREKIPLFSLLNSPGKQNAALHRHDTFMISDKLLSKTNKGKPKIVIDDFYELDPSKNTKNFTETNKKVQSTLKNNSLVNLLKIDSPIKKADFKYRKKSANTKGKMIDLHIYSDLKEECRKLANQSSFSQSTNQKVKKQKTAVSNKSTMLKKLQHEYYNLQKISIENYLKGHKINNMLIEMDFFQFLKIKRARLQEYLIDIEIKPEVTPIEKIINSTLKSTPSKKKQKKSHISLQVQKQQKKIEFLDELIKKHDENNFVFKSLENPIDEMTRKMKLYNDYYVNYFTPPENDKLFTSIKDLSLKNFSISRELMKKKPTIIASLPNRQTYNRLQSREKRNNSREKDKESIEKRKEQAKIGTLEQLKLKMHTESVEYVIKEGEALKEWQKNFNEKKEFESEEKDFFRAVKGGDINQVRFHLIDNTAFLSVKDQVDFFFFLEKMKILDWTNSFALGSETGIFRCCHVFG